MANPWKVDWTAVRAHNSSLAWQSLHVCACVWVCMCVYSEHFSWVYEKYFMANINVLHALGGTITLPSCRWRWQMPAGTTAMARASPPPSPALLIPLKYSFPCCKTKAKWRRRDCVRKLQENAGNGCREREKEREKEGGERGRERERQLEEVQSSASKTTVKIATEKEICGRVQSGHSHAEQLSNVPQYALLAQLRRATKAFRTCVHSKHSQCAALNVCVSVCLCVCVNWLCHWRGTHHAQHHYHFARSCPHISAWLCRA